MKYPNHKAFDWKYNLPFFSLGKTAKLLPLRLRGNKAQYKQTKETENEKWQMWIYEFDFAKIQIVIQGVAS